MKMRVFLGSKRPFLSKTVTFRNIHERRIFYIEWLKPKFSRGFGLIQEKSTASYIYGTFE